ncbi:MAG: apolipoprotein N-acyltransferase [Sandarakinorhabdus sp.]|nr:apolipoprotein N-acyltransferase [Sandarakinorhabdus sp.]
MHPSRLSLPAAALLAVVAGAMAALGFEPYALWPFTLLAAAVLVMLVVAAATRRRAVLIGWLFGTGMFTASLGWTAFAFTFQAKMPPILGWVSVVLLSMFLALYVGLAAGLTRALARQPLSGVLMLAAFWMLGEWLRGWVLTGFAWNPLGAAWVSAPGFAQLASAGGALSLSGLMILAGGGLWLLAVRGERAAGAVLLGLVGVAGVIGLAIPHDTGAGTGPMVYLVQPNIGQDVKYDPGAEDAHLQIYLGLTAKALAAASPNRPGALVLWSESSVPYLVEEDPAARARLAAVLGPKDLLLFGGVAVVRDRYGAVLSLTNSLFVIDATGQLHGRYDKAHLVPLGEYVPARGLMTALGVARLAPGDLDFNPGPGPQTLKLPGFLPVGVQICYEIIFPGAVIDAANRPAWIANISNDAWFGPSGPPQHLAQARLRAIEEGLPIARATPTGISAMIDPFGRVVTSLPAGARDVTSAPLPAALPATLFARFGHLVPALFGAALLLAGVLFDRRRQPAAGPLPLPAKANII